MPKRKPKFIEPGTLVRVDWIDAHSYDGWVDGDDLKELRRLLTPHRCQSVGYVLEHSLSQIVLIQSRGADPSKPGSNADLCGIFVIPSPMMRNIRVLHAA